MPTIQIDSKRKGLKIGAKISLIALSLYIIAQLVSAFQTKSQLVSPLIPASLIWEINKQFIFIALVASVASLVALVLYFFERYLIVIFLAALVLIVNRYIYI
jgi:hypothetical protein